MLAGFTLAMTATPAAAQIHEVEHEHDDTGDPHEVAAEQLGEAHGAHDAGDAHDDHGDDHGAGFHLDTIYKLVVKNAVPAVMGADADPKAVKKTSEALLAWKEVFYTFVVIAILAGFFVSVGRSLRDRDPTRKQLFAEMIVGGLYNLFREILGPYGRRFTPYLGTLFLFILLNNWSGLVPLGFSSTSSLANTTLGLGLMTFIYVQYTGIRENGIGGYLYHFAGQPKSGLEWGFAILIFPLEVLGELIRPISLSLRLFGNIYGEETLIAVMVILGTQFMQFLLGLLGEWGVTMGHFLPGFPFQFPFYFLVLIASTVQALVFTLLSAVYISLMLPHGHEEEAH
ncbi:F0F1 ATP synthase subunit A [bacterium]|nr:F0F1 ATP synthase subunit A [bacterium]